MDDITMWMLWLANGGKGQMSAQVWGTCLKYVRLVKMSGGMGHASLWQGPLDGDSSPPDNWLMVQRQGLGFA